MTNRHHRQPIPVDTGRCPAENVSSLSQENGPECEQDKFADVEEPFEPADPDGTVVEYSAWMELERWSVVEAASLIRGVDPRDMDRSQEQVDAESMIVFATETGHLEVLTGPALHSPIFGFVRVRPFLAWARLHLTGLPDELRSDSEAEGNRSKLTNDQSPPSGSAGGPLKNRPVAPAPLAGASTEHVDTHFTGRRVGRRTEVKFNDQCVMFSDAEHATLVGLARARSAEDPWWRDTHVTGNKRGMRLHHVKARLRGSNLDEIAAALIEHDGDGGSRLTERFSARFNEPELTRHPDIETSRYFRGAAARRK